MKKFLVLSFVLILTSGCSFAPPASTKPNISLVYRASSLKYQLQPLPAKLQPSVQESLTPEAQNLFHKLYTLNPALAIEVGRLPEFQDKFGEKKLLALARFIDLIAKGTSEEKTNLEELLKVGLPAFRRYCTTLQALFWLLEKDKYKSKTTLNPLNLSLKELLDQAWDFSEQDRWKDFNIVTERLNAPELVNYYERRRFIYSTGHGRNVTPSYVFKRNTGSCTPITVFTVHCLQKGGYKASKINVQKLNVQQPSHRYGHVVCLFDVNGSKYIFDNGRPDKFLRRGIIPLEEYEMYHDRLDAKKGDIAKQKDPVFLLQDNHGLVLIYLIEEKSRITNIETICKDLGVSLFERNARKAIKKLVEFGFISKPVLYKKEGFKGFIYKINESLCERFKKERYNRPQNAVAKW